MPWPDRRDTGAALGLLALLIALFWRLVFRGEVLYDRDIAAVFHPMAESFFRAWRAGSLPLWNPWFSFGEPMLANPSAQVLYPPTWLNFLLLPPTVYKVLVLGRAWAAAVGTFLLARASGLSPVSAMVAAATWVASGPFLSAVSVHHHFMGAAWMPFGMRGAERFLGHGRAGGLLELALSLAMQLLGGDPAASAEEVAGHHVRRELDAAEFQGKRRRKRFSHQGLGGPRNAFEQDMATA